MYKEIIEHEVKNNRGKVILESEISREPANYERYASLFSFDKNILEYVKLNNNSLSGYKGTLYTNWIWIDFDDKDKNIDNSVKMVKDFVRDLNKNYFIDADNLYYYFSGAKGFHVGIHEKLLGGIIGDKTLAGKMKEFVLFIAPLADNVIYEPIRIFRLPNSVNNKTGLYKIPLSFDELTTGDEIKKLAINPRSNFVSKTKITDLSENHLLSNRWKQIKIISNEERREIKADRSFFSPAIKGERNNTLYKQAAMLFDHKLKASQVLDICRSLNVASNEPLKDEEVETLILSASKKTSHNGQITIKTLEEWLPEWLEYISDEEYKLSLGFDSFDKDTKGKYRGRLILFAGYQGTKKSLAGMGCLLRNIAKGKRGIYSTMEMPVAQLIERILNYTILVDDADMQASEAIETFEKETKNKGMEIIKKQVLPIYSNKLLITQNGRMSADKYDNMLYDMKEKYGAIDILVVDGLSLMGRKGSEVDDFTKHSSELKELANKWNIMIILMCHISRGKEKYARDVFSLIRGSEQILDNCDMAVGFSLLIDEEKSTTENIEYRNDKGYMRFYNKRGSGKTINIIYDFSPQQLMLREADVNPNIFEVDIRRIKKTEQMF